MVLLVVFHHAAITYGAAGGWYYREVPTNGTLETRLLVLLCAVDQAYFMGLLFLLAGYFTPGSLARHGISRYAKEICSDSVYRCSYSASSSARSRSHSRRPPRTGLL
jgi:hypothetical protein